MGYPEKLRQLCVLKGLDQSELAAKVGLTKSSISRILNGNQVPKLDKAQELSRALGVSLDYLADDDLEINPAGQWVVISEDEVTILKLIRRLGTDAALDRLLRVEAAPIPVPRLDGRENGANLA